MRSAPDLRLPVHPMFNTFEGLRVILQGILARNDLDLLRDPAQPHGLQDRLGGSVEPSGLTFGPAFGVSDGGLAQLFLVTPKSLAVSVVHHVS